MKRVLFFLISIFLTVQAFSQSNAFRFGFTASPGVSWLKPDNDSLESGGARFAFDYGLIIDYKFGKDERYALGSGLQIQMDGGKLIGSKFDTASGTLKQSTLTAKLQSIAIPITLKLRSNEVGYITYYGHFGLLPTFVFRSRGVYSYQTPVLPVTIVNDNIKIKDLPFYPAQIDRIVPFDMCVTMEAGLEYGVSDNTALVAGIYFNNGFVNQVADNDAQRVVKRNFGVRIGVLF